MELVCKKIRNPDKTSNRKSKPGWVIRKGTQVKKNQQKQVKMIKQAKDIGTWRDKKEKATQEK